MSFARNIALGLIIAVTSAACNGPISAAARGARDPRAPVGGTLRAVMPFGIPAALLAIPSPTATAAGLDPNRSPWIDGLEIFHCCLLRTLLSYRGAPTGQGGADLHPDLASALPDISADGLTWTFHIRQGLHYAPPMQSTEITAGDFVRALKRTASLATRPPLNSAVPPMASAFEMIKGFKEFEGGQSDSIVGLVIPDPYTLKVVLTQPSGDLGARFALPATAPIPPSPKGNATYGVATGHDEGDGPFLVATGPYMIEGADRIDFSQPPRAQQPASGFRPGQLLTMVRNPSWSPSSDDLRPAYVDRIQITIGGTLADGYAQLRANEQDLVIYPGPGTDMPASLIEAYSNSKLGHIDVEPNDWIFGITMNLAVPPFDDLHVRKALNYLIDKNALIEMAGKNSGSTAGHRYWGSPAGHLFADSLENNLLLGYDPYAVDRSVAVARARDEMKQSRYDPKQDGMCDVAACKGILALNLNFEAFPQMGNVEAEELKQIGIVLNIQTPSDLLDVFTTLANPQAMVPIGLNIGSGRAVLNASDPASAYAGTGNFFMLGSTPEQLRGWGYSVTGVPSVGSRINECAPLVGERQVECWAQLDEYLMQQVVPEVPYWFQSYVGVVPARLVRYSYDQFSTLPALDQVAIAR